MVRSRLNRPKVIFLDAVGTLFGIRDSVGEIYAKIASEFGVTVAPDILERTFIESFRLSPVAAFPGVNTAEIPSYEFNWWKAIATRAFQQAGVLENFSDFSAFFIKLYHHFATAEPWFVYPEVISTLDSWKQQEIELGVISNFDSRLYAVLQALNLTDYFTSVTISTEVGAAKPSPEIFAIALAKHHSIASEAWHIGDSYQEDYQGAKSAGLTAIWLKRDSLNQLEQNDKLIWEMLYSEIEA